jgi:hypothetical protein
LLGLNAPVVILNRTGTLKSCPSPTLCGPGVANGGKQGLRLGILSSRKVRPALTLRQLNLSLDLAPGVSLASLGIGQLIFVLCNNILNRRHG